MNMLLFINNFAVATATAAAKTGPDWIKMILIALGIGLAAGLIYALSLKGSLTSVHQNNAAADYVRPGSFKLEREQDNFMYSDTSKKEKPKSQS